MAKFVVWGGMLIVALGGMFMGMKALNADPGQTVPFAIGEADANGECELQIVIGVMMTAMDPPYQWVSDVSTKTDWPFWAGEHFKITDAKGQALTFKKHGFRSKDISENQFGSAEQIVVAQLKAGQDYTFTYVPTVGQPEKYTLPIKGEAAKFRRKTFPADY